MSQFWNPDIIVIPAYATELDPQAFFDHPILSNMAAVKNGRVYKQPFFARTPDAPEIYLTSIWLAMVAHGGDFGNHFRQQISDTYETIYGSGLSAKQLDVALETEANADSAGFVSLFR